MDPPITCVQKDSRTLLSQYLEEMLGRRRVYLYIRKLIVLCRKKS